MQAQILETVIYKPKAEVDPQLALEKIQSVLDPFLRKQSGLVKAWRSRTEDGTLVDTVLWADEASFQATQAAERNEPALGPVFALFDEKSLAMFHARIFE